MPPLPIPGIPRDHPTWIAVLDTELSRIPLWRRNSLALTAYSLLPEFFSQPWEWVRNMDYVDVTVVPARRLGLGLEVLTSSGGWMEVHNHTPAIPLRGAYLRFEVPDQPGDIHFGHCISHDCCGVTELDLEGADRAARQLSPEINMWSKRTHSSEANTSLHGLSLFWFPNHRRRNPRDYHPPRDVAQIGLFEQYIQVLHL